MSNTITPATLADSIGVDAKAVRGFLRREFPRAVEAKNTTWIVTPDAVTAATEHFAKQRTTPATTPTPIKDAIRAEIASQA